MYICYTDDCCLPRPAPCTASSHYLPKVTASPFYEPLGRKRICDIYGHKVSLVVFSCLVPYVFTGQNSSARVLQEPAPTQLQTKTLPTQSMKTSQMHPLLRKEVIGLWNVHLACFGPQFSIHDSISGSYKKAGIYLLFYLQTFIFLTPVILEENQSIMLIEQPQLSVSQ